MPDQPKIDAVIAMVAETLRAERARRGFSRNAFAERAGVSPAMVSYVERRLRKPGLDTLLRMSGALGIEPWAVLQRAQECAARLEAINARTHAHAGRHPGCVSVNEQNSIR